MKHRKSLNRSGTGRYPKGKERLEMILNAAKDILIKNGYSGLTMRNVAAAADTTVGNLQYYYVDKDALLRDLLEYMVHGFFEVFASIADDRTKSAQEKLIAYITCIFDAFPVEDKGKFYPELWALANHDEGAATLMNSMYARGLVTLESFVSEINPRLTRREVRNISITILGAIEGQVVFIGYGRQWARSLKAVRNYTIHFCLNLIRTAGRE